MSRFAVASALAVLVLAGIAHARIPQYCLDCICEIESNCKALNPCCNLDWDLEGDNSCGSFQIKDAYWIDGGRQGGDWQTCACDYQCSIRTMQAYAARYTIASRIGHPPTCEDYARNHNGGPDGYKLSRTDVYWAKMKRCLYKRSR